MIPDSIALLIVVVCSIALCYLVPAYKNGKNK